MKRFSNSIKIFDWIIWGVSVTSVIVCFFAFKNTQYLYLAGALIGITAVLFVAKGNPLGQVLTVVFSVFYGIISYSYEYYGEMITYLCMSAPIAVWALVSWLKNPYDRSEVKVNRLSRKEWILFAAITAAVTIAFYFILRALGTANLAISTVSVFTSFAAAYLTARRSRFYAIGYAINDIILVILWSIASCADITYLPMIICFAAFLAMDTYGFINWSLMNKRQTMGDDNSVLQHEKD